MQRCLFTVNTQCSRQRARGFESRLSFHRHATEEQTVSGGLMGVERSIWRLKGQGTNNYLEAKSEN